MNEESALALTFQGGVLCRGKKKYRRQRRKYMSPQKKETKKTDNNCVTQSSQQITGFSCNDIHPVSVSPGRQPSCKGLFGNKIFWHGGRMLANWFGNFTFMSGQ